MLGAPWSHPAVLTLLVCAGCQATPCATVTETRRHAIVDTIRALIARGDSSANLLDAKPYTDMLLGGDSTIMVYDTLVSSAEYRRNLPGWNKGYRSQDFVQDGPPQVVVLAPDAAVSVEVFRATTVDTANVTKRARGAESLVWRRTQGGWRIAVRHMSYEYIQ